MRVRKSKTILAIVLLCAIGFFFLRGRGPNNPDHAGRPVSAWFDDLCSGVYGGTAKASAFDAAYATFSQVNSNAIPYLTQQLSYDRDGYRQKLIIHLRKYGVTKPFADDLMWPTARRNYAAVALRQMGPKAESAIPALLEAWAKDVPEVKVNIVSALESILARKHTDGLSPADWKKLEADVIAEAVRRYPQMAKTLRMDTNHIR